MERKLMCNPIVKDKFIPDVEAHVFRDGRLYLYGSKDVDNNSWCSDEYEVFSTGDMQKFTAHGVSIRLSELENCAAGKIYAPDCIEKDGKYYLYLCCENGTEWVAVGDTPVRFYNARQIEGIEGIDPSVFIDDDGKAYYFWGQFSLNGARLKDNMTEIDASTITRDIVTQERHFFHEGSSIRKRNGVYYLVFADVSRGEKTQYGGVPTSLGYATAEHPLGPYTYRGVIIDNAGCDPKSWNNHGSIECFEGQWYVFYHRSTAGHGLLRRVCAEKIFFDENGLIEEVEMTSSGCAEFIPACEEMPASAFCSLSGTCFLDTVAEPEKLAGVSPGDKAVIRYVRFCGENRIVLKGSGKGAVALSFLNAAGETERMVKQKFAFEEGEVSFGFDNIFGIYALSFEFTQSADLEITSVRFVKQ